MGLTLLHAFHPVQSLSRGSLSSAPKTSKPRAAAAKWGTGSMGKRCPAGAATGAVVLSPQRAAAGAHSSKKSLTRVSDSNWE